VLERKGRPDKNKASLLKKTNPRDKKSFGKMICSHKGGRPGGRASAVGKQAFKMGKNSQQEGGVVEWRLSKQVKPEKRSAKGGRIQR